MDEYHAYFLSLIDLLNDKDAINVHVGKILKRSDEDIKQIVKIHKEINFFQIPFVQSRQFLVILVTVLENAISEFTQCLFYYYPDRMYDFIVEDSDEMIKKGKVSLKDIIDASSKDELIYSLAKRATVVAMQGDFDSITKRLQKLTKNAISSNLLGKVNALVEQRNKIVHEIPEDIEQFVISTKDADHAFKIVINFIDHLALLAIRMNIQVGLRPSLNKSK